MGGVVSSSYQKPSWSDVYTRPVQIAEYAEEHYTSKYSSQTRTIVIRRDSVFQLHIGSSDDDVDLNKSVRESHGFHLYFVDNTSETKFVIPTVEDVFAPLNLDKYCCQINKDEDVPHELAVQVRVPNTASFGRYKVFFESGSEDSKKGLFTIHSSYELVIVFNPWSKSDATFMRDSEHRSEYVLEESGVLFTGTDESIRKRSWNFAQFSWVTMAATERILADLPFSDRADPVKVSRALSAKVNVQDDRGILVGNWNGDYSKGTSPSSWTSSIQILFQYHQSDGTPVKYGQCWVFAGILTTLLRCVGIPSRPVTNYSSGHDTGLNKCIDRYFDKNGNLDMKKTRDSVWNFHVWNEAWLDRPDLKPGRGGWQAVDATPQERSQGIYCTGPASLVTIRDGEDDLYDSRFLFAEVNADIRYWVPSDDDDGEYRLIRTEESAIGTKVLTKAVGSSEQHNVTSNYKYEEGSLLERAAVLHGLDPVNPAHDPHKIEFNFEVETDNNLGSDIKVSLNVTCAGTHKRTVRYCISAFATDYTGNERDTLRRFSGEKETPFTVSRTVSQEDYIAFLPKRGCEVPFEFLCHAIITNDKAKDHGQKVFVESKKVALSYKDLEVSLIRDESSPLNGNQTNISEPANIQVKFKNPLDTPLTNCQLCAYGPGMTWGAKIGGAGPVCLLDLEETVPVSEDLNYTFEVLPDHLLGPVSLVVVFNSSELHGVTGSLEVDVISDEDTSNLDE